MKNRPLVLAAVMVAGMLLGCTNTPTRGGGGGDNGGGDGGDPSHVGGMVLIPGGTFQMGSENLPAFDGATPVHRVTVSSFYMDTTDVTQADYQALMGVNPSYFDTGASAPRRPVESVDWYDAVLYCNARSNRDGYDTVYAYSSKDCFSGYDSLVGVSINYARNGYRLPTEAEWEYACRAGSTADFYWGQVYPPQTEADTAQINVQTWWQCNNVPYGTKPVAVKPANAFGLYDVTGNVYQWCNDWYGNYSSGKQTDPTGPASSGRPDTIGPQNIGYRMIRGGSWGDISGCLQSAYRYAQPPLMGGYHIGFRCVRRAGTGSGIGGVPSAPALASPANGATGQSTSPALQWNPSSGATSYTVQVSTAAKFSTLLKNLTVVSGTQTGVSGLAAGCTYYWRVQASDDAGTSAWSSVWHFTTNSTTAGTAMVYLNGGSFTMGSNDSIHNFGAQPAHRVTVSAFYIDSTDVTQSQYKSIMGINPSVFAGNDDNPVENVSWYDAMLYCNARSRREGRDTIYSYTSVSGTPGNGCYKLGNLAFDYSGNGYRLPTEAEWEYACRGGTTTEFFWGNDTSRMGCYVWSYLNSGNSTHPVASKKPNGWGLYDMAGNVYQWCNDYYRSYSSSYIDSDAVIVRGGAWTKPRGSYEYYDDLRSAFRNGCGITYRGNDIGFRCVRR